MELILSTQLVLLKLRGLLLGIKLVTCIRVYRFEASLLVVAFEKGNNFEVCVVLTVRNSLKSNPPENLTCLENERILAWNLHLSNASKNVLYSGSFGFWVSHSQFTMEILLTAALVEC